MLKTVCAKSSSVTLNNDSSSLVSHIIVKQTPTLALLRVNGKHLLSVRTAGESFGNSESSSILNGHI